MNLTSFWPLPKLPLSDFLSVPLGWIVLIVHYITWNKCYLFFSNLHDYSLFTIQIMASQCAIFTPEVTMSQTKGCLTFSPLWLSYPFFSNEMKIWKMLKCVTVTKQDTMGVFWGRPSPHILSFRSSLKNNVYLFGDLWEHPDLTSVDSYMNKEFLHQEVYNN